MSLLLYKTRCFYSQTRAKLEHREIKINLSGVFCATPCNKWLITILIQECPRGEIGRHKGLKILARLGSASSSLAEGTIREKYEQISFYI